MIGQVVDGHQIVRALGAGGMGEVYLARTADGRELALKVVRTDRGSDRQAAARFRREVKALAQLRHEAIVQIIDAGRLDSGALYYAMELVRGESLQAMVDAGGPLALSEGLTMLARVASGLAYAHARGIVHRDLKPANVLIEDRDPARAKIIDFGLAKIYASEKMTALTEDEQVLGSPLYWAPEQCTSAEVGPAADIYALGGIAYFALSGQPMFRPRPAVAMVYAHQHEVPAPLATMCEGIELPPGLGELVQACVAKKPGERPAASDLARELAQLSTRATTSARAMRPPKLFSGDGGDDAIENQIRQVALDIAGILGLPLDDIERMQNELSELELELAMRDADAVDGEDTQARARHGAVAETVRALRADLALRQRALVDQLLNMRPDAPEDAEALYEELDELFARHRSVTR